MQSTALPPALATLRTAVTAASSPALPPPPDLLAAFAEIPDPRRRQGTRFPLAAVLSLAVAALVSGHLSVLAIAEWAADQPPHRLRSLGLPHGVAPHQSTLQRLFRRLDPVALSSALSRTLLLPQTAPVRGAQGVAVDGKAQRGRLAFEHSGTPVHALSAVAHGSGIVLAQAPLTAHRDKAEAELTVAPALLRRLDWRGRVLTGDALYCQRSLCQQVVAAGGDYLLIVKDNQPTLHDDLRLLFDPPDCGLPLTDRREARSREDGHGRHQEVRRLVASTDLVGYSDWPGLAQVWRWERHWREQDPAKREVRYGITSLPPQVASAERLLELKRGHWIIENGLHYVKDVTLGEDRSLIHLGFGPMVMATLRDTTLNLLRWTGHTPIASALRHFARHPPLAVSLVRGQNA
jgi:predicted transposase YbfD/YdcC